MRTIEGKANIKATVICDSVSEQGKRITTFELEFPRIILAEFNTHRMLSRNTASSRAIPFKAMVENLHGKPVRFGAANAGMQDKGGEWEHPVLDACYDADGDFDHYEELHPCEAWERAKENAIESAMRFYEAAYHKQVYNRLLEPFQMCKTVVTATEWNNFFWLRDDEAAEPTIQELARCMKQVMNESKPQLLKAGEWHLPYVQCNKEWHSGEFSYSIVEPYDKNLTTEEAIKVSAARCAAVSYRKEDYDLEKCLQVYDRLVGSEKKHSSALEHQATPMIENGLDNVFDFPLSWQEGVTHSDRDGNLWSGNFQKWVQYRQLVPDHVKKG